MRHIVVMSVIRTVLDVLRGVYRLLWYGPGIWVVRAVVVAFITYEPQDLVVAAVTLFVLLGILYGLVLMLFEFVVACTRWAAHTLYLYVTQRGNGSHR